MKQMQHIAYLARKKAKAERMRAQTQMINVAGNSAHEPDEQLAESSKMGASRDALSGRFLPDAGIPILAPVETVGSEEPDDSLFLSEENSSSRSSLQAFLDKDRRPELVNGSNVPVANAPADEEDPFTRDFPDITLGRQDANLGWVNPAPASDGGLLYGNPADKVVPTQLNDPSASQWENGQHRSTSPTIWEPIRFVCPERGAHQGILRIPSPLQDYETERGAMMFSGFSTPPRNSPDSFNETLQDILNPLPPEIASPQFPVDPSFSSDIPIDREPLQTDTTFSTELNQIGNAQDTDQLMGDNGV